MRRSYLALGLLILMTGGAWSPALAEGTAETVGRSGAPKAAVQQAIRRSVPWPREATPAGWRLPPPPPALPRARPAILGTRPPLQCVPYARELSGIALRGDAWSWWGKAKGLYARGAAPRPGAVLVLSKGRRLRLGHLAVVAEVRNSREIVVHQANWLNGGRIHRYTPVRDVSENNDWSVVRVWYTPGRVYGAHAYPTSGFIYPKPTAVPDLRQAAR